MLALTANLPSAGLRSAAPRVAAPRASVICPSLKLYVGNLSWSTQKEDLQDLFGKYGNLEDIYVATDRETGRSRGFGFVTFESEEAAQSAIESTNEIDFMGRTLRVNEAQAPGERPEGGRGYGRGRGRGGYGGGDRSYGDREGGERRSYGGDRDGGERRSYGRSYGGDREGGGFRGGRGGGGRGGGRGAGRRYEDSESAAPAEAQ